MGVPCLAVFVFLFFFLRFEGVGSYLFSLVAQL